MPREVVDEELQSENSVIGTGWNWLNRLSLCLSLCPLELNHLSVRLQLLGPGEGARAAVLFHEPAFDTAAVLLEPGGTVPCLPYCPISPYSRLLACHLKNVHVYHLSRGLTAASLPRELREAD